MHNRQKALWIPLAGSFTLLLLVEEDLEFAKNIYKQVRRDRFMSDAKLFQDLVYKHLPEELTEINVETVEHNKEHREALWNIAWLVLTNFDHQLEEV